MEYTFKLIYPNTTTEYLQLTIKQFTKEFKRLQNINNNKLTFSILQFDKLFNSKWD